MLLLEEKTENSSICYYDSTNILASKYRFDTLQLAIIFKDGSQYVYEKVSNYTYQRFKIAESQGSAHIKHIKGKFDYSKASEKTPLDMIAPIIENLKKQKENGNN